MRFLQSKNSKSKNTVGFTLPEVILYLFIFAVVSVLAVNLFITMAKSFSEVKANRLLSSAGSSVADRLSRDIRSAVEINIGSTLGSSPGVLIIEVPDGLGDTDSYKYQITSGALHLYIDDVDQGALTPAGISITSLIYYGITTKASSAVRFTFTLQTINVSAGRSENFYGSAALRGGY